VSENATPLMKSWAIQRRVIFALLMRELITRFGRHNIGMLWLVGEPMLFTLGVAALWYLTNFHKHSNIPIIAFAITGYSAVLAWRNVANRSAKAVEPNLSLMYHRNVKVIDLFAARILLELVGATASLVILSIFFASIDLMTWPHDIFLVISAWLLLCWFGTALGLVVGAISERSETFERVWHVVTYLLFPLSGAAFMVDWLPTGAQKVVLWFPMVHGTEMLRHGYFGNVVRTHEQPEFLIVANLVITLIGMAMLTDIGRKVQPE
jgi:capsular polysaccharide transport system permease protein